MARSLTVHHEEEVGTSPLFTAFLLFSMAWLMIAMVAGGMSESAPSQSVAPAAVAPIVK